jgi:hypothetical protein
MLEVRFSRPRKDLPTLVYTDIERVNAFECHFVRDARCLATVMDPIDRRNVYVSMSAIPGANEGLFAKRAFPKGSVVVIYAGLRYHAILSVFVIDSYIYFGGEHLSPLYWHLLWWEL